MKKTFNDHIKKYIPNEDGCKTTQDLLAECEYKISRLESQISVKNNELLLDTTLLDKLKEQRKNYLNYLNSDNN